MCFCVFWVFWAHLMIFWDILRQVLQVFASFASSVLFWEFWRVMDFLIIFKSFWELSRALESFWKFLIVFEFLLNESTRLMAMALFLQKTIFTNFVLLRWRNQMPRLTKQRIRKTSDFLESAGGWLNAGKSYLKYAYRKNGVARFYPISMYVLRRCYTLAMVNEKRRALIRNTPKM